jgi:hypothetical protein
MSVVIEIDSHHSVVNYANGGNSGGALPKVKAGEIQFGGIVT